MSEITIIDKFIKLIKNKRTKIKEIENFIQNNIFDINSLDEKGYNPLHYLIKEEKPDLIRFLINYETNNTDINFTKIDLNIKTKDVKDDIYEYPLFYALLYVNDDSISNKIIKILIDGGADLNIKDDEGNSFFLNLCSKGKNELVDFILNKEQCPIDINKEKSDLGSGLHFAILNDKQEILTNLLEHNIDIGLVDKDKNTALHLALIEKQLNIFKDIFDYLVNNKDIDNSRKKEILNMVNNDGNTILHEASVIGSNVLINIIKKLPSEIGVDEKIKNKNNFDYKEVEQDLINKQKEEDKNKQKLKEEAKKVREEAKKERMEEEKRLELERQRIRERLERQEEFGKKLMEYKGYFFLAVLICIMVILFALVKNATTKKEKII